MNKLYVYAGIAASVLMITIGIGAIAVGLDGRSDVRDELARENIVGTPDVKNVANEKIDTGGEARDFAAGMRVHTLEATNGQTHAEMPRFLDENDFAIVMGIALFLAGVGFLVVTLRLPWRGERSAAAATGRTPAMA